MEFDINLQAGSEEAQDARRQVLTLIAAYGGGETTYLSILQDIVEAYVLAGQLQSDRVLTCERAGRDGTWRHC
jgi:hypothetical protein